MTEYIEYPSATAKGYEEAHEGDGVVLVHKNARGTVQDQKSPTLSCRTGGAAEWSSTMNALSNGPAIRSEDAKRDISRPTRETDW